MRKIILLFVAVFSFTSFLNAQDETNDYRDQLQFGLKLGGNYSNVYDTEGEDFRADGKFGLAFGAFLSIPISTFMGIQPEILVSQKGFQATGSFLGSPYKFTRTTTYLDIPLFFTISPSEYIKIMAGPQFSYLMKQKDEFTSSAFSYLQEEEFSNDNIRKNTLGFALGADINLNQIVIGARAGWDFMSNKGDGTSESPRYKNVWYQATIGYRF
jgi:hypothetical protein